MGEPLPQSGLHHDIDEALYHADTASLSSTSAKTLLYQGAESFFLRSIEPPRPRDAFDFGSVVHALVLGVGEYEVLFFDSWRTNKSKEAREDARARGKAPILLRDFERAEAMRDAVLSHGSAARLLSQGSPEVSLWARDPATDVLMRGRIDWLRDDVFVDLKTSSQPVDQPGFLRTVWDYRYAFQAAYYRKLLRLNGIDLEPAWIAVGKREPYEVGAFIPDEALMARCEVDVDRALALYAHCLATGEWPTLEEGYRLPGVGEPGLFDSMPYVESITEI